MKDNQQNNFLLLSTSLLIDRVYLHTNLVSKLSKKGKVNIWASSVENEDLAENWDKINATVQSFPDIKPFKEIPHNYLRRLNEYAWDYRYKIPSRMSMMEHVRNKTIKLRVRALKTPAKIFSLLKTEPILENYLEKLLLSYPRSDEAYQRLLSDKPDVIISTGLFQFEQPGIFPIAKKMKIPTIAYIPSWDNVTTKNRMVYKYDGYIVWNDKTKEELNTFYPYTKDAPVYVVGAPQFDIFHQEKFYQSKEEFCLQQDMNPNLPIIVYAIGSPNFLKEHHGAVEMAKRVANGNLGEVQLLVRPHPIHDNAEMIELFDSFKPRVQLQQTPNAGKALTLRTQDELQIKEWVNTFRHADVVINLSSTVTVDAAIFDKPVVNLDFDPQPSKIDQILIKDVNHKWNHFQPIAESGGVWLVNDFDEMENAVKTYLKTPELHSEKRKWIVEYVCGYIDGKCGERMADAIIDFTNSRKKMIIDE